jgi:hypothetical protein
MGGYYKTRDREAQAMQYHLQRPYWRRQWIIQEIWLARQICLQCGVLKLVWDQSGEQYANPIYDAINHWGELSGMEELANAKRLFGGQFTTLNTVVDAWARFAGKCSDPRDKFYGILALVPTRARIPVNYQKSIVEVFWDVVDITYQSDYIDYGSEVGILDTLNEMTIELDVENDIGSQLLAHHVQALYHAKGWEWPPAKTSDDPRWYNRDLIKKRYQYSAKTRYDWSQGTWDVDSQGKASDEVKVEALTRQRFAI